MDLSKATLPSGQRFHRFHEHFNRIIKTNAIALTSLRVDIKLGKSLLDIKKKFQDNSERPWGDMPDWKNTKDIIEQTLNDVGGNGVFRVFSAFDLFLDELQAELDSYSDYLKADDASIEVLEGLNTKAETDRLFKFLEKKRWTLRNEKSIKPVYTYYLISRNCLAHRNGLASEQLAKIGISEELKSSTKTWKKPVQKWEQNELIKFTHRDAIFACSILREIALELNSLAIKDIELKGIIYLIAKNHFLREDSIKAIKNMNDFYSYFQIMLTNQRIFGLEKTPIKIILDELGLRKQCSAHFEKLKLLAKR